MPRTLLILLVVPVCFLLGYVGTTVVLGLFDEPAYDRRFFEIAVDTFGRAHEIECSEDEFDNGLRLIIKELEAHRHWRKR